MIKNYFLIFWLLIHSFCFPQEAPNDSLKKQRTSNAFIALYEDDVKVRLGLSNSFNSFHIKDGPTNLDFTLSPNQQLKTTLTVIYKFIEIDLGYTPRFIRFNKDDAIRGTSKFFTLGTRLYFGQWMQDLHYSKTKGFYVDKADIGIDENILFPNFRVQKIGGSTSYIFNENFSYRAINLQSEWQRQSAGSFMPSLSYYFTQIKNDSNSKDNGFDFAVGPAYYYNWVLSQRFLISGGAYGGLGYNSTKTIYQDGTPDEVVEGISLQTQFRFTLGYSTSHFYTGATASLNSFYYDSTPRTHVQDRQQFFELYIGYRFKGPEKIKNILENPPLLNKKKK